MARRNYCQLALIIALLFFASCAAMWGNHSLGDNFSLLEGDRTEDRIVAYCYGGNFSDCRGASPIVPTYERHYLNGSYAEYAESAKSNEKWIVVKTIETKNRKPNYWIINKDFDLSGSICKSINCDSFILSHVLGPLGLKDFQQKVEKLEIGLSLE